MGLLQHNLNLELPALETDSQINTPKNSPLKLFGYDLFAGEPDTFQPSTNAPYVVKVDGSVRISKGSGWPRSVKFIIEPGDTEVVPMDMDR